MFKQTKNSGFTLIEIIVVLTIMAILIALSMPFVTSLRADIAMQQTLRQVKVDLVSTLNYSLAGKSFGAISKNELSNPNLIPQAYSLYFEVDETYGDQSPYLYIEHVNNDQNALVTSYKNEKLYPNSSVFLKQIALRKKEDPTLIPVKSAHILILPPFGKVLFIEQGTENQESLSTNLLSEKETYDQIQLTFKYKDDGKNISTLTFDTNKILNLSIDST